MSRLKLGDWEHHRSYHTKQNSWWAKDAMGIELCRICHDCEHLLVKRYSPEVLGISGEYTDVVEERIDPE
jgi:hypothetical protein